jgi:hypothetical protein
MATSTLYRLRSKMVGTDAKAYAASFAYIQPYSTAFGMHAVNGTCAVGTTEHQLRDMFPGALAHNVSARFSIKSAYEVFVNAMRASELEGYIGDMLEDGKISFSEDSIEGKVISGKTEDNISRLKAFHESLKDRDEENASKKAVIFNVRAGVDEKEIRQALQGAYQFLWEDVGGRQSRVAKRGGWKIPPKFDVAPHCIRLEPVSFLHHQRSSNSVPVRELHTERLYATADHWQAVRYG